MDNQISFFPKEQSCERSYKEAVDETLIWNAARDSIYNIPNEQEELLPGIKWGNYAQLYTPAFWKLQYLISGQSYKENKHRLCSNILEEIVMCLLGGFGIPSEMGIVAFQRFKEEGLIKYGVSHSAVNAALSKPFTSVKGKTVRYRFHNQKSKYLYALLNRPDLHKIPLNNDLELRRWLLSINGIGLKTASWITRNWLNSNKVAILDIHIIRAGILAGIFDINADVSHEYLKLEEQYLAFCLAMEVPPADLDAIIWLFMKNSSKLAIKTINYS